VPEAQPQTQFRVLGAVEASAGADPVPLGGPRQRGLLALLLLNAGKVVPRDALVDGIWGEAAPQRAANALQVQIHALRKHIGTERIETHGSGYRIRVGDDELDVLRFEELVQRARAQDPEEAGETLRAALALWRGPALANVEAPFAATEAARLEDRRLAALEARIDADLRCGRDEGLAPELEALVELHPFREGLWRQLLTALYRTGRQAEALEAYRRARRALRDELGIEPSPELRELHQAILRQDPALAAPLRRVQPSLPTPAHALIGRRLELAAVVGLLRRDDVRLLTLTGPGGIGKTRLALAAAHEIAAEHPDGAFLVDLSRVRDPALVPSAVAEAVGLAESPEPIEAAMAARLAERRALLLVDNVEHVVAGAPAIARLLEAAPGLTVLATSRIPLRIAAESEYRVPPLDLPSGAETPDALAANDAVALFVVRARAVDHGFQLSAQNAAAIADVCRALDGLPLAIELAAARVDVLSPSALVQRLRERLDVLTTGRRDAPERQRTLRATIAWSHDLLEPAERRAFARLSVFAGGFTLEDAEGVCGADLDSLASLVAQSLLASRSGADGEHRFSMLETIREFAAERLEEAGAADDVAHAHCARYLALAEEAAPRLFFDHALLARLDEEHANLRAALAWARDHDSDLYLRLGVALWRFWYVRGLLREGRSHLEAALEASAPQRPPFADGLKAAAILAVESHDYEAGAAYASRALGAYRERGDERGVLTVLTVLGNGARLAGSTGDARRYFDESREIAERLGLSEDVAVALQNLATVALDEADFDAARELVQRALAIHRAGGRRDALANGLTTLAYAEWSLGHVAEARAAAAEAFELARALGYRESMRNCLLYLAAAEHAEGRPRRAAELIGAADAVATSGDEPYEPHDRGFSEETLDLLRDELGDGELEAALAAGRARPLDELFPPPTSVSPRGPDAS
jgi:predicted ATPase/DNA-binding SARP family transcriptional activator